MQIFKAFISPAEIYLNPDLILFDLPGFYYGDSGVFDISV
jgi:hypothetical protein